ncbi:hypothetical protein V6N13_025106 [Hibiscus sabdariffa]
MFPFSTGSPASCVSQQLQQKSRSLPKINVSLRDTRGVRQAMASLNVPTGEESAPVSCGAPSNLMVEPGSMRPPEAQVADPGSDLNPVCSDNEGQGVEYEHVPNMEYVNDEQSTGTSTNFVPLHTMYNGSTDTMEEGCDNLVDESMIEPNMNLENVTSVAGSGRHHMVTRSKNGIFKPKA